MVRGGGYTSGAGVAGRYNASSAGSRGTAGVRSWARARLYSKNTSNATPRYQYYYGAGRPVTGTGGAGPASRRGRNFAISRGRFGVAQYSRAGYSRYFPRGPSGAGYLRGGTAVGGGRSQAAPNISARAGTYRGTRGGAGAGLIGGSRGAGRMRGRGGRGGLARGGGVRGFARGAFRGRGQGGSFRGRGRGRGGGRGGRGAGGAVNKETLDAELDKYMGEDYIKKRLDNDLEKYFSRSGGGGTGVGAGAAGAGTNAGGAEQTAGVVGGVGSGAAGGSVVDSSAAGGANTTAAGAAPGGGDATTNGTLKPTGGMDVSMDNSL